MELQNLESSSIEETETIKPLNELYQLVLDNFDLYDKWGICIKICRLYKHNIISNYELDLLLENLDKNKPKWYNSKFWWNKHFSLGAYWWKLTEEGNEQRKLFLQHLIKKYS